jgi:hypothetical protein
MADAVPVCGELTTAIVIALIALPDLPMLFNMEWEKECG